PLLRFPFDQAAPKVTFKASCRLVAFLSSLGKQLHDDCRDGGRETLQPLFGRYRLPCNVAVNPFHRIGSREGKTASQHFVKRDTQGVEIAPGIDGTIHSSGLLGCHIGECSGDELGRLGRLALAWKPRSDTKAHQPALAGNGVCENVGRLDILVDDAALMQVTNRSRKADGQTQRKRYVHWLTEQLIERHTAWIRRNEYRTVPVASNCNRPGSPARIQLLSKRIFVLQPFQAFRRGTLHRRRKHKNLRSNVLTLPAIKNKIFILTQCLEHIS